MKIIVALSILILLILLISNKIKPFILFGSVAVLYYLLGYLNLNTWLSFLYERIFDSAYFAFVGFTSYRKKRCDKLVF